MNLYPAPRWFREVVNDWLAQTPPAPLASNLNELYTRIVNAQPTQLRVVQNEDSPTKGTAS